jgi:hypothetical protein
MQCLAIQNPRLPDGFNSRLIGMTGQLVEGTDCVSHG